ncbi:hypothetical protein P4B35_20050 [Pontiellaceae bacterium B12227]|nr:hypothetical protein [Pontiellaceae bacterium B12227]
MKNPNQVTAVCSMRFKSGLSALLLVLAAPHLVCANLSMTLNLDRNDGNFRGSVYMYTTGASDPITTHRIESPNGIIYREIGNSYASSYTNLSFSALMNECTNGLWSLTTNLGDPSEEQYDFAVSIANVAENMFGDTSITNPADTATVATNQPLIEWTSTSLFPEVHIQVHNGVSPPQPGNWVNLAAPVNSWTPASPVLSGDNTIYLAYQTNSFAGITITVPTNMSGTAVAAWISSADLSSYDFSYFTVPGGGGDPFDAAVESPGLTWNTYGNNPWFISSLDSSVGPTALQSDAYDYEYSTLETTIMGPGTVTFDWALFADYGDSFEFESYDNETGEDYDYFYYEGYDAYGWDSYSVTLNSNDTYTFTWTFYNDDDSAEDLDAAFIDNVVAPGGGGTSYGADFEIDIERVTSGSSMYYVIFPRLLNAMPSTGLNEVESPNGFCSGTSNSTSSAQFSTLQDAINEIEGGDWTVYFDRNGASHQYTFTIAVNALSTNDIPPVVVLNPLDGATGVSTNTDFAWLGPPSFDSLFVLAWDVEAANTLSFESLPSAATTWTNAPVLSVGTNSITISYTSNNFNGLTISYPVNASLSPISSWSTSAEISTRGSAQFVAGGVVPLPVTLLPPTLSGGDLGLSFVSQPGTMYIVEWSTNLVTGPWLPATNFPGDGSTNMVSLPATNPAAYFRVDTY